MYSLLRLFAFAISKTLWRLSYSGKENIPKSLASGLIVSGNHQTYMDPVWIAIPIKSKKIRFLAWDRAFNWRFIGRLMRYMGAVPVNTRTGRSTDAWRAAREALGEGNAVMIFPEGEREFADGKLLPFKQGAVRLALESGVPILPVTVKGANKVWPQGMRYPRTGKVRIVFHPLMEFTPPKNGGDRHEQLKRAEDELRAVIESAMD